MARIVCQVLHRADRITFLWSEGAASFEPYHLDGAERAKLLQVAAQIHAKLAHANGSELAQLGNQLFRAVLRRDANDGSAEEVYAWLTKRIASNDIASLEFLSDAPGLIPWNVLTEGNEAGISSATFIVKGRYAYGLLHAEAGTHRLVRISPFDSQARRQTSFAGFTVAPFMEDIPDIVIEEKDIRVDTYRATGAGGQHINTTDSAIRITHLPTGVVVTCQNQRSQIQNRARAMQVLAAKLAELAREEREAQVASIAGPTSAAAWGNQIRSYVLAPYQMVKDLRTQHETAKVDAVLDGDIEEFMEAWLHWRRDPTSDSN